MKMARNTPNVQAVYGAGSVQTVAEWFSPLASQRCSPSGIKVSAVVGVRVSVCP